MNARAQVTASDGDILATTAENPGWKVERTAQGQLVMTPPTGGRSSRRNARLTSLVDQWARNHGYVAFDSNGGFLLPDSSIVAPDAALVEEKVG